MKKVYKKPQVCIEKFELSQHIASCEWIMDLTDPSNCEAHQTGQTSIFLTPDICDSTDTGGITPDYCTFNGGDSPEDVTGSNVFSS